MTMPGRGPRQDWAATCELCEWSFTAHDQSEAKVISVLHVLIRHPHQYLNTTGKNPADAREAYAVQISYYRKNL